MDGRLHTALGVRRQVEDCALVAERLGWALTAEPYADYVDKGLPPTSPTGGPGYPPAANAMPSTPCSTSPSTHPGAATDGTRPASKSTLDDHPHTPPSASSASTDSGNDCLLSNDAESLDSRRTSCARSTT